MAMYSIYASFRHPHTGREVATVELATEDNHVTAEAIAEILTRNIAASHVGIVEYLKGYYYSNKEYMPLVVVMKRFI